MENLTLILEGEGGLKDLADKTVHHLTDLRLLALDRGMVSGAASVAIVGRLPGSNGNEHAMAETSLALLLTAGEAFAGRYGDPRESLGHPIPSGFPGRAMPMLVTLADALGRDFNTLIVWQRLDGGRAEIFVDGTRRNIKEWILSGGWL